MAIINSVDLGANLLVVEVNVDPTTTAVDVPKGSIILFDGIIYKKLDNGLTTNTAKTVTLTSSGRVGIATDVPNAPLDISGDSPGSVGGFASGSLHITSKLTDINSNAVITGHNSFSGNKQLWYLGSTSSSNDDIALINRQNAKAAIYTNNIERFTITKTGIVGIGVTVPDPSSSLEIKSTTRAFLPPRMTTAQIDGISSPSTGLIAFDTNKNLLRIRKSTEWCYIPCGVVTGQFSHGVSQKPSVTTPVSLLFDMNDITLEGISHSTSVKPEEFKATIQKSFTFMLAPQWERTSGGAAATIDFFMQKSTDGGTVFVDEINSNIKVKIESPASGVVPLMMTSPMNVDDIVRFQMRVSTTSNGLGTVFTAAETGSPTIPATPAQILTIFSGD